MKKKKRKRKRMVMHDFTTFITQGRQYHDSYMSKLTSRDFANNTENDPTAPEIIA
jgi:hypothetical protein